MKQKLVPRYQNGSVVRRNGDPYEYSNIGGNPMYRKNGSNSSWIAPNNSTASQAIMNVLGMQPKKAGTPVTVKVNPDNRSDINSNYAVRDRVSPIQWATPEQYKQIQLQEGSKQNQGTLTNLGGTPSNGKTLNEKASNYWNVTGGRVGTNLEQLGNLGIGLAKTVGSAAAVTAMGAVPALGAAYSLYNLPGATRQAYNTYSKSNTVGEDVTLGEQVRDYGNLGLLVGGTYGGIKGTLNAGNPITTFRNNNIMGNQQAYRTNSYNQEIPGSTVVTTSKSAGSIANQNMNRATQEFLHGGNRTQNVQVQGNNVKPQGTAKVVSGPGTTYINQRPGNFNSSYLPTQGKAPVVSQPVVPVAPIKDPFYLTGYPSDNTPSPTRRTRWIPEPIPTPPVKKEQRVESVVYKRGSEDFENAWKASINPTFMYNGKLIRKQLGGTRYVGPDQNINKSTLQIIPDSTSTVGFGITPGTRVINGGIQGNPNIVTVNKSNL